MDIHYDIGGCRCCRGGCSVSRRVCCLEKHVENEGPKLEEKAKSLEGEGKLLEAATCYAKACQADIQMKLREPALETLGKFVSLARPLTLNAALSDMNSKSVGKNQKCKQRSDEEHFKQECHGIASKT